MSLNSKIFVLSVIFIMLTVSACNLPAGVSANNGFAPNNSAAPTATFTPIAPVFSPTPSPLAAETCKPTVTTSVVANIRSGPGQAYNVIGSLPQGGSANVAGKSMDGTWWYIEFAGGFAWISNTVTTPNCIPTTLASIAAPPVPVVAATDVPAQVAAAPSATTVPSGGGSGIIKVPPGFFQYKSPTPTKISVIKKVPPLLVNPIIIQPIGP